MKKLVLISQILMLLLCSLTAFGQTWKNTLERAESQTVYFNAWGGSQPINDYIAWAASMVKKKYNINVVHVKVTDIGQVVSRIIVEKSAGKRERGSVDLLWINGENFKSMKENNLLYGPFSQKLPNYEYLNLKNKKAMFYDFTEPVDNLEAPWGTAQLVFLYDTKFVKRHPGNMSELLFFAKKNPGRFTYPAIPEFHGTTFLKQALLELAHDPSKFKEPVVLSEFKQVTQPLWDFLEQLHPNLWHKGKSFPASASKMQNLLNDGEIFISLNFNPNAASNAIASGELPDSIRTYVHRGGTIGNSHFLGIPFNSSAREASMVFANFLLSPLAQAKKLNPQIWGDSTVLDLNKIPIKDKELFNKVPRGIATLSRKELGTILPEPHVSWVRALEKEWLRRYGQ